MINFTIEDIEAAYAATGLKPGCSTWISDLNLDERNYAGACPLGALLTKRLPRERLIRANNGDNLNSFTRLAQETLGLEPIEIESFISGVDGYLFVRARMNYTAYALGNRLRRKLFPTKLTPALPPDPTTPLEESL